MSELCHATRCDARPLRRLVPGLIGCLLFISSAVASHPSVCPVPEGLGENPLASPGVTAGEVAADPTPENLQSFAVAARDYVASWNTQSELAYGSCLMRKEGEDWRSGDTYSFTVSLNPEVFTNPQAPIDMRVSFHAKDMGLGGRPVNPSVAGAILAGAASDPAVGGPVPGIGGYAALYGPFILVAGLDLQEAHMVEEVIESDHVPHITASEVVDRATLKSFVNAAIVRLTELFEAETFNAATALRSVLRDENGPWRAGPVYLFVMDRTGYTLFHGAFPDRFELQIPTDTLRDAVTGELILPKIIAAATKNPAGAFIQYHFDNPDDDSDSADIPKVAFARENTFKFQHPTLGELENKVIVGAGIYQQESGTIWTQGCPDHSIVASAVNTQGDIRAFVECAAAYLAEHGTVEARRAFNEDVRWKSGPTYVFVDGLAKSGTDSRTHVYPPNPSREGQLWGEAIDDFGNDLFYEAYRMMQVVDSGWIYYSFPNPATGRREPKASYVIEIDWDGEPAVIGAGIYELDLPATCNDDEVSAAVLEADRSPETLQAFLRCAAQVVESEGYDAKQVLETDPRWSSGSSYAFVLDMQGNQVISGRSARLNGQALHEWGGRGGPDDQFGGRDMIDVGSTFGESFVYYQSFNPLAGTSQPKVGLLKRVVSQGVPLLVGAGYFVPEGEPGTGSCSEHHVTAGAIRTREQMQAFVQCAAEYAEKHGEAEARRAFNEDERWKQGQIYVFVDSVKPSGEDSLTHVFPPDPSREGSVWGKSIDSFGTDYFFELHRLLELVDEGWIYYAFGNPATGLRQPKSSYVKTIDWNGDRAAIGAGYYSPDLPGTCEAGLVNAALLESDPSDTRLQEFVRCAALMVERSGYFAAPVLSSGPRWRHGSIYVFGINVETGAVDFSGSESSFAVSGMIPELLFDGRDAVEAAADFGEGFWYYNFTNPATGEVEPKTAYVKLVRAQGVPLLVGSGYDPRTAAPTN